MAFFREVREDIRNMVEKDPAARNGFEVLVCYPGIWALIFHRPAHWLYKHKMKLLASVLCGIFCGFAGAHLSLGYLTMFTEGMSNSRGFIAFACVIFGMANPPKVFLAALLFGFLDALGLRLQSVGVPSDLTSTVPYIATVLMLVYVVVSTDRKKKKKTKQQLVEASERA